MPKPADQTGWPFWTTATETPGTLLAVMKAETAFSIWARFAGESALSFSAATAQEMTTSNAASKNKSERHEVLCRRMEIRRNMCGSTLAAAHTNLAVHHGRTEGLLRNRSAVQRHPAAASGADQDQDHAHD